ncbi:ABC transporter permease [Mameliella alba]|uniref:Peptide ABC transporter permease protein n=1 Tax=Mameliella alba TaxID=561184 RepID=A0A0B3RXM3_9RHOB|nr:ABC transporter permease [Mameliella alba]MBV6636625.1 ABC transporter permease [Mameliella sp.]KHQ52837.1 Peptide ABC transporter permease protein [Mameliella alba]MBY6118683.1 ABC transporter permease [Mameliella alba]OWV41045.1 ABC transporter permease [Mameliella alba]OWV68201.1 ABC transporter permease [Mameliella alba]
MTSGFAEFLLRRIVGFAGVLLVLALMIFILARVVPGDPARIALGPTASAEQLAELREEMGLDDPLPLQFVNFLGGAIRGDFGNSLISGRPVAEEIAGLLPATLELVLATLIIMLALGLPLGILAARYRNSWFDAVLRIVSLAGVTMPSFLFAILLQLGAAYYLTDWPILGRMSREFSDFSGATGLLTVDGLLAGRLDITLDALRHLAFPALALSMSGIGQIMRITRSAMIEHQRRDHVQTLRSFGVPGRVVTFRYLLKLSAIAPLTIMGLEFASLIGNAFVVEMVFSWGGFASAGLEAVMQKDLNAVMAVVLVSGCFFVVANLLIDILIGLIDPRLRMKEAR